jgi:hypothetical protein
LYTYLLSYPKKTEGQEGKLMGENFLAGQFLRKADKSFGVCIDD